MTRPQRALGYFTVVVVGWGVVGILADHVLAVAAATGTPISALEALAVAYYSFGIRYLPYLATPVVLAPVAVVSRWLVPRTRPKALGPPELERRVLGHWLVWLAAAGAVTVASLASWDRFPLGVKVWGLLALEWSYAGALHRCFRLHTIRHSGGHSRVSRVTLVYAAGITLPIQVLGWPIPLWVFWASRRIRESSAAQQEAAPDEGHKEGTL
jgi:hypothetical protein